MSDQPSTGPTTPASRSGGAMLVGGVIAVLAAFIAARVMGLGSGAEGGEGDEIATAGTDREPTPDATATPDADEAPRTPEPVVERLRVNVLHTYPHSPEAFTQGLLWHEGHLYESTGLYGESSLRRVALETGEVLQRRAIEPRFFAEGLARVGDRLFQLTWQEGETHVFGLDSFEPIRTFEHEGEGWGLCYDGARLVMSDGSARLFFRDPESFELTRTVTVRQDGEPVDQLNELECVDGVVWANVWQTDRILRIDPASGRVTGVVDARGLLTPEERREADVLNGIAWIPERGHFVITGKQWPHLFEVDFVADARE